MSGRQRTLMKASPKVAASTWIATLVLIVAAGAIAMSAVSLSQPKTTVVPPVIQNFEYPRVYTFENVTVENKTTLKHEIAIDGNVICTTPVWPSCLDISGQSCMYPLQESCLPSSVAAWNVTDLTMFGTTTCPNGAIDASCIPANASFNELTVQKLTALDFTYMTINEINQSSLVTDYARINNNLTCAMGGFVDKGCIDISGEICSAPVDQTCVPSQPTSSLTCDAKLGTACVDISGHGTCSSTVDASCIPAQPTSSLTCDTKLGTGCVDISGHGTCSTPIDSSCVTIPPNLVLETLDVKNLTTTTFTFVDIAVNNQTMIEVDYLTVDKDITCNTDSIIEGTCIASLPTSKLTCDTPTSCVDISGHGACSSAVDPSCIDISNKTCSIPLDGSCVSVELSGNTCATPLDGSCIDISMKSCSMPINANCVDISGETCSAPVDASCVPTKGYAQASLMSLQQTVSTTYTALIGPTVSASVAGTYHIMFTGTFRMGGTTQYIYIALIAGGSIVTASERAITATQNEIVMLSTNAIATVGLGGSVGIMWKTESGGTLECYTGTVTMSQI